MPRRTTIRAGILFAILPWFAISCGTKTATQPGLSESITAMPAPEQFLTSPQGESRELLINGRPTPIEWNIAGPPTFVLMHGGGGAGDFYLSIRSVWSTDRFGAPAAMYFLLQWPDLSASVLERPVVNDSVDILDDQGNLLVDCRDKTDSLGNVIPGNDVLLRPTSWHRSNIEEDQVVVEIFSDSLGSYPADNWRWGAGTTDPVFPSSTVEFANAASDGDSLGQFTHPAAGVVEDRYDVGAGPVDDEGRLCFIENFTLYPNGIVPKFIASKGSRDTRLNRGHPVAYTIWSYVHAQLTACDSLNPVRIDDSGTRDKTWNPGDYVPSYELIFPTLSQFDVLARGGWDAGKWNLEIRRRLSTPWPDDVELVPGRTYMMRVTVYDASSTRGSRSALLPLKLRLR
ncbi:MAG TPA: ethylbenzene dehydrogenase-related protein [Candidatus Eisenbacteria bacterium]